MKMWLRELPDPLLTFGLHQGFIEAASAFRPRCPSGPQMLTMCICIPRDRERQTTAHPAARKSERASRSQLRDPQILHGAPKQVSFFGSPRQGTPRVANHDIDCFRIAQYEVQNAMSISNIAIVFGPTLFGHPAPGGPLSAHANGVPAMADAAHQNKVNRVF